MLHNKIILSCTVLILFSITFLAYDIFFLSNSKVQKTKIRITQNDQHRNLDTQCRFYLAESAIRHAGLGVFTTIDIPKGGETHPMPDICIYILQQPKTSETKKILDSHTWQDWRFHGAFENLSSGAEGPRALCEGVSTLFNNVANVFTSVPSTIPSLIHSNAGLERSVQPGAGSITQYYGITSKAEKDLAAGSEITIGDYSNEKPPSQWKDPPTRTREYLEKYGMCMDYIRIKQATDPKMGRGAFTTRALSKASLVAPAPLLAFRRSSFRTTAEGVEEVLINYCFQPRGVDMLLFPYGGAGVGLINHSSKKANVGLRWSTTSSSNHHGHWLDLSIEEFWRVSFQGGLILEIYALRDLEQNEELFLDYGQDWEHAWNKHVKHWKPTARASEYVYPIDMMMNQNRNNEPFKTIEEQKQNSAYAFNLMTVCNTANRFAKRNKKVMEWREPRHALGYHNMIACQILQREQIQKEYYYTVSLHKIHDYNSTKYHFIDTHVPHSAISWVDKPFYGDMYLPNAFRHSIALPEELTPSQWIFAE